VTKSPFQHTASIENEYISQLRKVAKNIGAIVDAYTAGDKILDETALFAALDAYSAALVPWATALTEKIISNIDNHNEKAWNKLAKKMSDDLQNQLENTSTGAVARQLQLEQVDLITSLPQEAGLRAQKIAQDAFYGGMRADVAAEQIAKTGAVTASRATLIARTETSKTNTAFTTARAQSIGAYQYVWETSEDADVRPSHAAMEGKVFTFGSPPEVEGEGFHAPGDIYNCRCWANPIIPKSFFE
jgi:SPP1 gp7 family putative phage head morphogenesis protein